MPTLTLYSRVECHLCDEMKDALHRFQQKHQFALNIVDIDEDSYLQMRYGERIPVLAEGEQEICHYQFNETMLLQHLGIIT